MDLPTSAGIGATLTFYLGHEWTTASITIFVVGFLLMQSCSGRWGALMVLSSAARVVSIKLCVVGKIISTLSDASCLVTCNLQPAFCTNWLVLLPVCFCRSQHGETDGFFLGGCSSQPSIRPQQYSWKNPSLNSQSQQLLPAPSPLRVVAQGWWRTTDTRWHRRLWRHTSRSCSMTPWLVH